MFGAPLSFVNKALPFIADTALEWWRSEEQQREGARDRAAANEINTQNYMAQKEFAQNSVRWRVEDAVAAGLHPLAALGASASGYSPTSVVAEPDHSRSEFLGRVGQNITRAVAATSTARERQAIERETILFGLDVDGRILDNQYKQVLIDQLRSAGPGMPSLGSNRSGQSVHPSLAPDIMPDMQYRMESGGNLVPEVPIGLSESIEASPGMFGLNTGSVGWFMRNRLIPRIKNNLPYPDEKYYSLPKDHYWKFDRISGSWVPTQKSYIDNRGSGKRLRNDFSY